MPFNKVKLNQAKNKSYYYNNFIGTYYSISNSIPDIDSSYIFIESNKKICSDVIKKYFFF